MNLSNASFLNLTSPSNILLKEEIVTNLNYSPLVTINFIFIWVLHLNIILEFAERWLKIKNFYFNLIFTSALVAVNTFYFFTHHFPWLGFYY